MALSATEIVKMENLPYRCLLADGEKKRATYELLLHQKRSKMLRGPFLLDVSCQITLSHSSKNHFGSVGSFFCSQRVTSQFGI